MIAQVAASERAPAQTGGHVPRGCGTGHQGMAQGGASGLEGPAAEGESPVAP